MQTIQNSIPESKHFYLEIIKGGIFSAIAKCGGGAFCNSGIIDLGGQTLIFDTFETPIEVEDLRVAGNFHTRNPITRKINSHAHADHWFGNQVFNGNVIIISEAALQSMHTQHESAVQSKSDPTE